MGHPLCIIDKFLSWRYEKTVMILPTSLSLSVVFTSHWSQVTGQLGDIGIGGRFDWDSHSDYRSLSRDTERRQTFRHEGIFSLRWEDLGVSRLGVRNQDDQAVHRVRDRSLSFDSDAWGLSRTWPLTPLSYSDPGSSFSWTLLLITHPPHFSKPRFLSNLFLFRSVGSVVSLLTSETNP